MVHLRVCSAVPIVAAIALTAMCPSALAAQHIEGAIGNGCFT